MRSIVREGSRVQVLVVDDDPLVRALLSEVLHESEFDLRQAADGTEALRVAGENVPDVIVLDVMMPGVNGFEVCRRLRTDPRFEDVRIVMLTARDTPEDKARASAAGADAFFSKPFSPLDLIEIVAGPRKTTT
ncbi:MAG: response regulator [Actinomycetota bacterium]